MLSAILSAAALGATAVADDPLTRATKLVSQMTTAEKLQFIQGAGTHTHHLFLLLNETQCATPSTYPVFT